MAQRKLEWLGEDTPVVESEQEHVSTRLELYSYPRESSFYLFAKRAMDIVLSTTALVVLMPFMVIIALIICFDDPHGSPIFVQDRVGKDGQVFRFLKYRSMVVGAEDRLKDLQDKNEMDGPVFKIRDDPRVTKFGRFIRRTSIDELPQLINIIKGEMSLVGPRPALPREVEQYDSYMHQRLGVRPGLTCYWQVQKHRNELSFDQWLELDLQYIRERSLLVDWKIIFRTVGAVLGMHGQ